IERYFLTREKDNIATLQTVAGVSSGGFGGGQNSGRGFLALKDWDQRKGKENTAEAIAKRAGQALSGLRDVEFYATVPASVRGLGQSSGFTAELVNSSGLSRD